MKSRLNFGANIGNKFTQSEMTILDEYGFEINGNVAFGNYGSLVIIVTKDEGLVRCSVKKGRRTVWSDTGDNIKETMDFIENNLDMINNS